MNTSQKPEMLDYELIERFLTKDVAPKYLLKQLDMAYYMFAELIMKNSNTENMPVCDDEIEAIYWLRHMKEMLTLALKEQ